MSIRLHELLTRSPRYGIGAAATSYRADLPVYIRITDIDEFGRFRPAPAVSVNSILSRNYLLTDGDLVVARTGASVGKSYRYRISDGELVYAGFLIAVHPDPRRLDSKYLSFILQSKPYWDWIASESMRSGQPGINARQLAMFPIEVPDIEVQRAVADKLSDVDELVEKLERLIAKKRDLKQGMMQELLTGKTRLPGFVGKWRTRSIGDVATVVMGQSPRGASYNARGEGTPLIQGNADIDGRRTFARIWTTEPTKRVRAGDVVLTVRAPVGYTAVATEDACLGRGVCALSAEQSTQFLFHALVYAEPAWALLEQGSTFTSVNSVQVRSFEVTWADDPSERLAISKVLDEADAEIAALERRLASARAIKEGMMQELLTGRTRLPAEGVAA